MCSLTSKLRQIAFNINKLTSLSVSGVRNSSYKSSPFLEDLSERNVKYEVSRDKNDWKYVERLLKPLTVPVPVTKERYLSDWRPQSENVQDRPYFVGRSKNYMIPVYLVVTQRGMRKITQLRRVQGDIWLLEKELRDFLQEGKLKPIRSQVNEFAGFIKFHGDHVNAIKHFLTQRDL